MNTHSGDPYVDNALSNLGGAAGGLLAGGLLGSSFGPLGIIIGTGVGATAGLLAARFAPFPRDVRRRLRNYLRVRALLQEKFSDEIRQCFLLKPDRFALESGNSLCRLRELKLLSETGSDKRFPADERWELLNNLLNEDDLRADLELLAKVGPIWINASSISVGTVASLTSLQERFSKFNLDLRVSWSDINGREQIVSVVTAGDFDFTIVPIDPFALSPQTTTNRLRRVGPVYGETQRLFRKKSTILIAHSRVWVYSQAAPEMQYRLGLGIPRRCEKESLDDARKIPLLIDNIAGGDYVIAWDPLSHVLRRTKGYEEVPGGEYQVVFYLFCDARWRHPSMRKNLTAFKRLFQNEWIYCREHQHHVLAGLRRNADFMSRFAEGCGLSWTSDFDLG